jgi:hypothetical protein
MRVLERKPGLRHDAGPAGAREGEQRRDGVGLDAWGGLDAGVAERGVDDAAILHVAGQ